MWMYIFFIYLRTFLITKFGLRHDNKIQKSIKLGRPQSEYNEEISI